MQGELHYFAGVKYHELSNREWKVLNTSWPWGVLVDWAFRRYHAYKSERKPPPCCAMWKTWPTDACTEYAVPNDEVRMVRNSLRHTLKAWIIGRVGLYGPRTSFDHYSFRWQATSCTLEITSEDSRHWMWDRHLDRWYRRSIPFRSSYWNRSFPSTAKMIWAQSLGASWR